MKYSQEYAKIMEDSGFPLEWRESAIEYKHLKKLIKKVSHELTSLGLNPVVLNRLLHPPTTDGSSSSSATAAGTLPSTLTSLHIHPSESPAESSSSSSHQPPHSSSPSGTDLELEFEFSSDSSDQGGENEDDYTVEQVSEEEAAGKGKKVAAGGTWMDENGKRFRVRVRGDSLPPEEGEGGGGTEEEKQRVAEEGRKRRHEHERVAVRGGFKAEYDLVGTATNPIPRLRLLPLLDQQGILQPQPRRASATSIPHHGSSRSSSHSPPLSRSSSPSSPSILRAGSPPTSLPLSPPPLIPLITSKSTSPPPSSTSPPPLLSPPSTDNNSNDATSDASSDGASARDDEDEPTTSPLMASTPRYFFSSVKSPIWALQAGAEEGLEGLTHSPPGLRMPSATLSEEPESVADDEEEEEEEEEEEDVVVPPGFTSVIGTSKALGIPIVAIQPATPEGLLKYGGSGKEIGEGEALMLDGMGPPGLLEEGMEEISMSSSPLQHELYIDLASDLEFFNVLTHALTTLDTLQRTQQDLFRRTVTHLCATISSAAIPPPPRTTKQKLGSKFKPSNSGGDGHSDLYAWREVFTLWIEAEIFESGAERDRGERGIEEAERRLKAFAGEVTRRGLGDRRTLKSRESRAALNTFLQLNLTLLDLKKFQTANIQAARKILKKHDKRTALTASSGFPQFVISSLSAPSGQDPNNIKTWTLFDASLPHVLLACLTETLLPIIPSLDDYSCAICTSIAFKPIRLDCGHLFCVRCLAKMQRRGKTECPLCRAPVLASADGRNLDMAAMRFMKDYFPREVKIKQKENEKEVAKEDAEDMGMGDGSCTIC